MSNLLIPEEQIKTLGNMTEKNKQLLNEFSIQIKLQNLIALIVCS